MIDNYLEKRTVTVIERVLFRVMKMVPGGQYDGFADPVGADGAGSDAVRQRA